MLKTELVLWTAVCIVGTVGVIRNLVGEHEKLGRRFWSMVSLVVGIGVSIAAMKLPPEILQVWTGVTAASLFYDTIMKFFQKSIKKLSDN